MLTIETVATAHTILGKRGSLEELMAEVSRLQDKEFGLWKSYYVEVHEMFAAFGIQIPKALGKQVGALISKISGPEIITEELRIPITKSLMSGGAHVDEAIETLRDLDLPEDYQNSILTSLGLPQHL